MNNVQSPKSLRPLWREPIAIGMGALVLFACLGVWFQDRLLPGPPIDPGNKAALPAGAGGGFCDLPAPVKSTIENPSTQKSG